MPEHQRRLIALRHTAVAASPGLCYGHFDVPLAASYADDLKLVQRNLPQPPYARVVSSPLQRCYRLALDLQVGTVEQDARLMELSFGQWEGQHWADIPRVSSEHWTADVVTRAPPAGETFLDLIARVKSLLDDPDCWMLGDSLLLVTHAGVIRALQHILRGDDYASCLRLSIHFGEYRLWMI